jgi:hypothetical protein
MLDKIGGVDEFTQDIASSKYKSIFSLIFLTGFR